MLIYYYGLKRVQAMYATIAELFFPVSAVALDYVVNGSVLSPVQAFSAVVLVATITRIGILQAKT
ncbi:hypothetical protein D6764_04040 [Candidatus Woesearchaeota archaeon]|nr:MAG: hypothetical protein D6764_04040 [Candidatus Woesearchaeota archaeon]